MFTHNGNIAHGDETTATMATNSAHAAMNDSFPALAAPIPGPDVTPTGQTGINGIPAPNTTTGTAPNTYTAGSSGNRFDLATRAMTVTLKNFTPTKNSEIAALIGCSERHVQLINKTARERGYTGAGPIRERHVADLQEKKRGRPLKRSAATDTVLRLAREAEHGSDNSTGGGPLSCSAIAAAAEEETGVPISHMSVFRILQGDGLREPSKLTPGTRSGASGKKKRSKTAPAGSVSASAPATSVATQAAARK